MRPVGRRSTAPQTLRARHAHAAAAHCARTFALDVGGGRGLTAGGKGRRPAAAAGCQPVRVPCPCCCGLSVRPCPPSFPAPDIEQARSARNWAGLPLPSPRRPPSLPLVCYASSGRMKVCRELNKLRRCAGGPVSRRTSVVRRLGPEPLGPLSRSHPAVPRPCETNAVSG